MFDKSETQRNFNQSSKVPGNWSEHLSAAQIHIDRQDFDSAQSELKQAKNYADSNFPRIDGRYLDINESLAKLYLLEGRHDKALGCLEHNLEITSALTPKSPANLLQAVSIVNLLVELGEHERVAVISDSIYEGFRNQSLINPAQRFFHSLLGTLCKLSEGKIKEGFLMLGQTFSAIEVSSAEDKRGYVYPLYMAGRNLLHLGDAKASKELFLASLRIVKDISQGPENFVSFRKTLDFQLVFCEVIDRDSKNADATSKKLFELLREDDGQFSQRSSVVSLLTKVLLNEGRIEEAENLLRDEVARSQKLYGKASPPTIEAVLGLIDFFVTQSRYSESYDFTLKLEAICRGKELGPQLKMKCGNARTQACVVAQRLEEAIKSAQDNYEYSKSYSSTQEAQQTALLCARVLFAAERFDEASDILDEVMLKTCPLDKNLTSACSDEYPQALLISALISLQKGEVALAKNALDSAARFTSSQPAVFAETLEQSLLFVNAALLHSEGKSSQSYELLEIGLKRVEQTGLSGSFSHCRLLLLQLKCAKELGWSKAAEEIQALLKAATEEHKRRNDWFIFRQR